MLCLFFSIALIAQTTPSKGMALPKVTLDNLVQGRIYLPDLLYIKGSQYLSKTWVLTDVKLQNKTYHGLPTWYDIFLDELVLLHSSEDGFNMIQLTKDHIQSFVYDNRLFVNLKHSSYKNVSGLRSGFYEIALEGQVELVIKRRLEIKLENTVHSLDRKDRWFLIKGEKAHRIRNKKGLLALFEEVHHKSISTFLKKQRIRMRKATDAQWLQLATFLNSLKMEPSS